MGSQYCKNRKIRKQADIAISNQTAVTIVIASEGYPDKYEKGIRIKGLENLKDKLIFHAGTKNESHDVLTAGGRVLNVVGFGSNLELAINDAYNIVKGIDFSGKFYRKDIGLRGLNYLKKGVKND